MVSLQTNTESRSKMQKQEVCKESSIVLLLTLIRHNMVIILTISSQRQNKRH